MQVSNRVQDDSDFDAEVDTVPGWPAVRSMVPCPAPPKPFPTPNHKIVLPGPAPGPQPAFSTSVAREKALAIARSRNHDSTSIGPICDGQPSWLPLTGQTEEVPTWKLDLCILPCGLQLPNMLARRSIWSIWVAACSSLAPRPRRVVRRNVLGGLPRKRPAVRIGRAGPAAAATMTHLRTLSDAADPAAAATFANGRKHQHHPHPHYPIAAATTTRIGNRDISTNTTNHTAAPPAAVASSQRHLHQQHQHHSHHHHHHHQH